MEVYNDIESLKKYLRECRDTIESRFKKPSYAFTTDAETIPMGMSRREYLHTMVNYNDKTIKSMGMYLTKKIGIPATTELNCVEWNHNTQFIATGGAMGVLKIVKLESSTDAVKGSNNLSVNQNLEGHTSHVTCAAWNEAYQKLTTSDANGLIIVWGMHNDSWFEEMINNRNKSTVVGMGWNCDGTKIAIAYADGQVIVGTLEGNRIWNKDLPNTLAACEWAPDGNNLIFGTTEGEVHIYDGIGNFIQKIHMIALDSVELETALASSSKDLKLREKIVCIKWYSPVVKSKIVKEKPDVDELYFGEDPPVVPRMARIVAFDQIQQSEMSHSFLLDRPRLLVAYRHGVMQLMRAENDPAPIIVKFPYFDLTCARWSPNGAFIAVTGFQTNVAKNEQAIVHIVSAFGKMISFLRVRETASLTAVAWDPSGLRIAITTDSNMYFGNIRPQYKWGYIGHTVIYVYEKEEKNQFAVAFYETKLEELYCKTVSRFEQIACHEDYCVVVNRQDDQSGTYFAQLCNGIGTALDFKYTDVEPQCVALNHIAAVIAGGESYFIWHFVLPKYNSVPVGVHVPGKEGVFILDNPPMSNDYGNRRRFGRGNDSICALCMADGYFFAACESGALFKISLSDGVVLQRYSIPQNIESMQMNCTFTRIATLDKNNMLQFFEISESSLNKIANMDRWDVWSYKWDSEKEDMIALNEKTKLIVLKGNIAEEPVNSSGYICSFKGLIVRTVLVDNFLLRPDCPEKRHIHDIEIKSLREVKFLLERMKIEEATEFIEKNAHPRLWKLLADVALSKQDIETAEHAYVKLQDYSGIQFCKKLVNIPSIDIRKAEVFAHLGKYDRAEKIFMQNDRRDLAISMYTKANDWRRVLKLLTHEDEDVVRMNVYKKLADFYYERMNWKEAAENYGKCNNLEKRISSLIRGERYGPLEELARSLPDNHAQLERLGDVFGRIGLCDQAVDCFLRCGLVKRALSCCIELNYWERANQIAKSHNLKDVDSMLGRYAEELNAASNEKSFSALQLYRRAGRLIDAAKIAFDIANDERLRSAPYMRLKKIHVMGALLVEQIKNKRSAKKKGKSNERLDASRMLEDAMNEEMELSIDEFRIMEKAWRGAEAYHFYMMAQQRLYEQRPEDALRTAVLLPEYEEYIEPYEIHSLIALASANVKQFSICSKAMMRIEGMESISMEMRNMMRGLSINLFKNHPPSDSQQSEIQCPNCEGNLKDYELSCATCYTKYPLCIASGRILLERRFWMCMTCKHRAYEHEIIRFSACPLCHSTESFETD